jgi:hypothetical protein
VRFYVVQSCNLENRIHWNNIGQQSNGLKSIFTQVEAYGPDPVGIQRNSPDHGSSIPVGMSSDFSDDFGPLSHRKSPEKFEDIPAGILLP